ncbi:MAG: hypothetical protein ACOZNI_27890 [Myxococcota bacterium]
MTLLLLLACSDPEPPPASGDSGDTDTPDSATDTDSSSATSGTCDAPTGDAVGFDTVYAGNAAYVDEGAWEGTTVEDHVFASQAEWDGWTAGFTFEGTLGSVDFSNHRVAAGLVVVPSTCGLSVVTTTATQAAGQPIHVEIGVEDSSGACDTACSAVGQMIVALSVPTRAEGEPTVCVRRIDGC